MGLLFALVVFVMLFGWLYQRLYSHENRMHYLTERVWWHWQNFNTYEDKGKIKLHGSGLLRGRAWLHGPTWELGFEWHLFQCQFNLMLDIDDEDTTLSLALPFLFAVYFSIHHRWFQRKYKGKIEDLHRRAGIRIFSWAIWLDLWQDGDGWGPRRKWHFAIDDFILGNYVYSKEVFSVHPWMIEMAEGDYPATITMMECTWKRPRWPRPKRMIRAEVEIEGQGIPHPGKGTASWNISDDALMGGTYNAATPEEAARKVVESVMYCRENYPL